MQREKEWKICKQLAQLYSFIYFALFKVLRIIFPAPGTYSAAFVNTQFATSTRCIMCKASFWH